MSDYQPSKPDEHGVRNCIGQHHKCKQYSHGMDWRHICELVPGVTYYGNDHPCLPWLWHVLDENRRMNKALDLAEKALKDISDYRRRCHDSDVDMDQSVRDFLDDEEWSLLESSAKYILTCIKRTLGEDGEK